MATPIEEATANLRDLINLLKVNAIPGMREKDQKTILDYLIKVVDNLIAAQQQIDDGISAKELKRIKDDAQREAGDYWQKQYEGWKKEYMHEVQERILDAQIGGDDD